MELSPNYNLCCIYPCSPFIDKKNLNEAKKKLNLYNNKFITPIIPFSHPIQRGLILNKQKLRPIDKSKINSKGQDLREFYHDAGQFYWAKVKTWLTNKNILTNSIGYKLSRSEGIDINNLDDWKMAEKIFKAFNY